MKPIVLLRIASVVALVQFAAHTLLFVFGYGLEAAFFCLLEAVLFWQLATIAKTTPLVIRPIVALFFLANIGHAILVLRYFFITPLVPDILIAACLSFAFMTASA